MKKIDSDREIPDSYLIDSCGWIEYFSDGNLADAFSSFIETASPERCFTPTVVIYEVYKKITSVYSDEEAMKTIAHIKDCTTIIDLSESIAMNAADISLNKKIPMADSMILATAKSAGAKVITSDKDFRGMDDAVYIEKIEKSDQR